MRSLFHFPFPAQPPSQQPSHCSQKYAIARILHPCAASAAPQRCFPLPARSPVPRLPRSGPRPTVARIASTPLRAAIRIPLCRHRADPALIAPPITTIVRHHPHRAHRALTSASPPPSPSRVASAPGPWLARIAPHASLFRRMRERGPPPGSIRPKCMLFEIKMATSSPHASISGRNRAIQDTWRANLAAKGPLSRRGTRNHARREDVASAARDFRGSGLRSGRTGFAPCGSGMRHAAWPNGLCALRRGPGLLAACAPPAISLVPAARVHRRRLTRAALRRPRPATRSPYRCISLPARRTHPASRADPPRPGNKRNNTSNSMRA